MTLRLHPVLLFAALTVTAISQQAAQAQSIASPAVTEIRSLPFNSSTLDYAPTITADGRTLYFVSDRSGGRGGHDIWMATRTGDGPGEFGQAVNIGAPVNTADNEGVATITADGRTIFFTACGRPDGYGDCDIYVAELVGGSFTNVRNLGSVNSAVWDSQPTVSGDGRTLMFVSSRPGALGGSGDVDIYVTTRRDDGSWSPAINAGPSLNTNRREDSPYLHPSGRYIYFSTAGRGGEGGLDFFVAPRVEGGWGAPVNLGTPINTGGDERFITVPESATEIYFSSTRAEPDNRGMLDIFVATGLVLPSGIPVVSSVRSSGLLTATPNPASDRVDLTVDEPGATTSTEHELTIADARGSVVERLTFTGTRTSFSVASLPNGVYLLRVGARATTLAVSR